MSTKMDIWALGCVLLFLATGKSPYHEFTEMARSKKMSGSSYLEDIGKLIKKSSPLDLVTNDEKLLKGKCPDHLKLLKDTDLLRILKKMLTKDRK